VDRVEPGTGTPRGVGNRRTCLVDSGTPVGRFARRERTARPLSMVEPALLRRSAGVPLVRGTEHGRAGAAAPVRRRPPSAGGLNPDPERPATLAPACAPLRRVFFWRSPRSELRAAGARPIRDRRSVPPAAPAGSPAWTTPTFQAGSAPARARAGPPVPREG